MAIDSHLVQPNLKVNLDGEGTVIQTGPLVSLVSRTDGKVDTYTTEHLIENGEVHEDAPETAEPVAQTSPPESNPEEQAY